MIDTIVIRVHDLRRHCELVKFVNMNFNGTSKNTLSVDKEDADEIRKLTLGDEKLMIDYFRNSKTGTHLVRYKSQERLNNSGHYYFHAFENRDRDFLEFNFSVPKYFYGTNVYMFTENYWNKNYTYHNNRDLKYNFNIAFDRLIGFIRHFFLSEFADDKIIDLKYVEINRIDLCYNQVFKSPKAALEYLKYQKGIVRKNTRKNSDSFRDYETSLMYKTDRYSLKVYHKGAEFEKNDAKELQRINSLQSKNKFNVEKLQSFADRILRYEITFRHSMLSYLFNHNIFRMACPTHRVLYKIYKKVESINQKNERIIQISKTYKTTSGREKYLARTPFHTIKREDLKIHSRVSKLLSRNRRFMLAIDKETRLFNSATISCSIFIKEALFSKLLFKYCAEFFLDFVSEYQVEELPSQSAVEYKIDRYNESHYHKLPKQEMLKFYTILMNSSFHDIKKSGLYSKSTFYRYKSRFEKIGVTERSLITFDFIHVKADLSEYHMALQYEPNLRPKGLLARA
ncbi:MAG: phage/plasmid replication domain-containing protein [Candidatus Hodarchaeales archaeon]